jgi:hypothetical protein
MRDLMRLSSAAILLSVLLAASACMSTVANEVDTETKLPNKVLWAWKRSEDLRQINPHEYGVAYLACHVFIEGDEVKWESRNQPLKLPPKTIVVPTVRIDVLHREKPTLAEKQLEKTLWLIERAARAPHTAQIQIDFDALETERDFYRSLLVRLRKKLPGSMPISITALASWCLFDNWIKDLPIDEAVPMMFSLGRDREKVLLYFRSHRDFIDERSKRSLGLSLEDTAVNELMIPLAQKRKIPVRVYVFTKTAWTQKKLEAVNSLLSKL